MQPTDRLARRARADFGADAGLFLNAPVPEVHGDARAVGRFVCQRAIGYISRT